MLVQHRKYTKLDHLFLSVKTLTNDEVATDTVPVQLIQFLSLAFQSRHCFCAAGKQGKVQKKRTAGPIFIRIITPVGLGKAKWSYFHQDQHCRMVREEAEWS